MVITTTTASALAAASALEPRPDGRFTEQPAPATLPSWTVTLLDVYGSLYYAGAKTLATRLPDPSGAERPVVVLRLPGRTRLRATSVLVIDGYAKRLAGAGGRLFLNGVDTDLAAQLDRTGKLPAGGDVQVVTATQVIGESSDQAYAEAQRWLADQEKSR
jgi:SulP family sulfate permease